MRPSEGRRGVGAAVRSFVKPFDQITGTLELY